MIIGIGHDLVDMDRMAAVYEAYGARFLARSFTGAERALIDSRAHPQAKLGALSKRWAAKEACAKALGTGFRDGVFMRDIGVVLNEIGRPLLQLTGGALAQLEAITPEGYEARLHLSLSDEPPQASAYVMIEACKKDEIDGR